jgi:hypothetical protein
MFSPCSAKRRASEKDLLVMALEIKPPNIGFNIGEVRVHF